MTKVINSTSSKTIGTNKLNIVDVNTDKIIKSDSEFREVVKKGYLLNNINLSTIPDIIQNAINQAVLDAKEQTLADAMIETLRLSILNLDDGIYKKTYIDNTITYLENLLTSKASPEIVASIVETKIAVATAEFATTSQVNTLSSRANSSEVEIISIKETISTKDLARATQINELEASINDIFAGYSEAIDLIVDANGNVKSEKIEKLEANNSMATVSINEENKISLDAQGNYVAFVAKFIADNDGKIVGYNFSDTNDLTNFTINADVFKISNSDNSYTPFTIDGSNILFNGKITFANVTETDGIVTTSNVQTVFNSEVTTIDGGKITTNSIDANKINTVGLIAENISANEIVGKTLVGAVINGASINGAVIKASYLDLDGELEVLTNYHITPAMYNANPSLYTDAVYLSGTNEYRIPSLSTIREETKTQNISINGAIFNSKIRSYNCANAGHNLKCVKNITSFTSSSLIKILTISNPTQSAVDPFTFSSNKVRIYIGGINIGLEVQYVYHHIPSNYDAEGLGSPEVTEYYWLLNGSKINSITVNGFSFTAVGNELYLSAGTYNLLSNFTDTTSSLVKLENIGGWNVAWYGMEYTSAYVTYYSAAQSINIAYMSTNITINNMI